MVVKRARMHSLGACEATTFHTYRVSMYVVGVAEVGAVNISTAHY